MNGKEDFTNKKSKEYYEIEEIIKETHPVWKIKSMMCDYTPKQLSYFDWMKHIDKLDESKTINQQLDLIAELESKEI